MGLARGVRDFGGIKIDTREWPLIIWEMPPQRVSDVLTTQALGYLEELWRDCAPGEKTFQLTDMSGAREASSASSRKIAADFMARNEALQARASVGGAIVVTSAVMRGVLTAVFWLRPPSQEMKIVASREEGILYGLELLAAVKPLPENLQIMQRRLRGVSKAG